MAVETTDKKWYRSTVEETLKELGSGPKGLSSQEAAKRLEQYGRNELAEKEKISPWAIFFEQFKSVLIIILLIATVLSAILGETGDAILIFVIVVFAAGLGFIQEYRAEKAMEALKKMAAPLASVMRDGQEVEVAATDIVPGDVVHLRTGDRVPADSRLIEAVNLKTDEAALTGESTSVEKVTEPLQGDLGVGDRKNMVFTGTAAVYGRGMAVVTSTGMSTEFGKIATMLQEVEKEQTPLQINLDKVGKWIGIGALVLCFALAGLGVLRGHEILEMFIWAVALAVAAVPEALPAVVVISLALAVRRMVERHALIRKLAAAETLGSTDYICSDKTGTLTQDQMTIRRVYVGGRELDVTGVGYEPKGEFRLGGNPVDGAKDSALLMLLKAGTLCNDTTLVSSNDNWTIKGDPTEGSFVVAAAKVGLRQDDLNTDFPRVGEVPFSSERKRMTTVHQTPEGRIAYSKGAPEIILGSCTHVLTDDQETTLSDEQKDRILAVAQEMAGDALRVLGAGYRKFGNVECAAETTEQGMVFAGLVGMIDPPREEVKDAVRTCDGAGIKSVMITGDHKLTAVAIAKELGILKGGLAVTGAEIDKMTDQEFEEKAEKIEVYARVSPAHKLRVVEALTKKGHVVAMTGDGVNDAPALKKADIGVAMGITGTDVTKEAADMVLTDDNFASIVAAVEEGRGIFANIKKYLMYLLSSNVGEVLVMAVAILFGPLLGYPEGAIPLIAVQILFMNLVTDGLPAIALAIDPPEPGIMSQKPRPRGQGIFTGPVVTLMMVGGIWSAFVNLGIFHWALVEAERTMVEAQALTFLTLVAIQFFKAYNFRHDRKSMFSIGGVFSNKWLNWAILSQVGLMLVVVYTPFLQEAFGTFNPSLQDWVAVILLAASVSPVLELAKAIIRWRVGTGEEKL